MSIRFYISPAVSLRTLVVRRPLPRNYKNYSSCVVRAHDHAPSVVVRGVAWWEETTTHRCCECVCVVEEPTRRRHSSSSSLMLTCIASSSSALLWNDGGHHASASCLDDCVNRQKKNDEEEEGGDDVGLNCASRSIYVKIKVRSSVSSSIHKAGQGRELDVRDLQACDSVRHASSMTNTDGAGGSKARQVPQRRGSRTRRQGLLQLVSLVGVRHAKGVKVLAAANLELGDRRRLLNLDGCKKGTGYRRSRVRRARRALASAAARGGARRVRYYSTHISRPFSGQSEGSP